MKKTEFTTKNAELSAKLAKLDAERESALESENYSLAKSLKPQIDAIKAEVAALLVEFTKSAESATIDVEKLTARVAELTLTANKSLDAAQSAVIKVRDAYLPILREFVSAQRSAYQTIVIDAITKEFGADAIKKLDAQMSAVESLDAGNCAVNATFRSISVEVAKRAKVQHDADFKRARGFKVASTPEITKACDNDGDKIAVAIKIRDAVKEYCDAEKQEEISLRELGVIAFFATSGVASINGVALSAVDYLSLEDYDDVTYSSVKGTIATKTNMPREHFKTGDAALNAVVKVYKEETK